MPAVRSTPNMTMPPTGIAARSGANISAPLEGRGDVTILRRTTHRPRRPCPGDRVLATGDRRTGQTGTTLTVSPGTVLVELDPRPGRERQRDVFLPFEVSVLAMDGQP